MKTRRKKKTKTNSPVLHIREDHSERGGFFVTTHFTHQFPEEGNTYKTGNTGMGWTSLSSFVCCNTWWSILERKINLYGMDIMFIFVEFKFIHLNQKKNEHD
jgi:hypothetical protein